MGQDTNTPNKLENWLDHDKKELARVRNFRAAFCEQLASIKRKKPDVSAVVVSPLVIARLKESELIYTLDMADNYHIDGVYITACQQLTGFDMFAFRNREEAHRFKCFVYYKSFDCGHNSRLLIESIKQHAIQLKHLDQKIPN